MKKIITVLLVAVLCSSMIFSLAACTPTARADFEMPEDFDAATFKDKEIEITFYHTMSATTLQPTLDKYIKEFNKMYPNITVKHEAIGGYDDVRDQLKTEISADNQPNLAYCYPDHVALYNKAKAVVSLDSLIESDIVITTATGSDTLGLTEAQKNDFIKGYWDEGKQFGDDKMYTLPFSKSTEVLYYNVDAFKAAGLVDASGNVVVPDHWFSNGDSDKTSMEYVCKTLKTYDPSCIPLGYDSEANWFITMCEQYGSGYTSATGNHFLFDNDTNHEFVKKFSEWYNKGWLTTQKLYGSYTSGLFVNNPNPNTTDVSKAKSTADIQRSYMSIGSSAGATHQRPDQIEVYDNDGYLISTYPFEVGIASIPQQDANNKKVISQGPDVCIFKDNDPYKVIASWLFLKYLTTSTEFQADFSAASGYVPVLKSVVENPAYKANLAKADGFDNIAYLSAKVCMEQESYYYTSPAFVGSSTARDQVGALLISCINNAASDSNPDKYIKDAFKKALEECKYQAD